MLEPVHISVPLKKIMEEAILRKALNAPKLNGNGLPVEKEGRGRVGVCPMPSTATEGGLNANFL